MTKSKSTTTTKRATKKSTRKNVDAKKSTQTVFGTRDLMDAWKMSSTKNVRRILRSHDVRIGRGNEHKWDRATFNRYAKFVDVKSAPTKS